jgi:hypothetical protein
MALVSDEHDGQVYDHTHDRWIDKLEGESDTQALFRQFKADDGMAHSHATTPVTSLQRRGANPYAVILWVAGVILIIVAISTGSAQASELRGYSTDLTAAASLGTISNAALAAGVTSMIVALALSGVRWLLERVTPLR